MRWRGLTGHDSSPKPYLPAAFLDSGKGHAAHWPLADIEDRFSELVGATRAFGGPFVPPIARFEAFRRPLVQDFCPMLSLFFRPHFNRGLGPVRLDPDDMPS